MNEVKYDIVEGMDARDIFDQMAKKTRNGWLPTGGIAIGKGSMGERFYQAIYKPIKESNPT